uniref:Glycerol kinase n=1 Tax=Melanaphis sacchari TaxID=742174 RepID=A0A2H8TVY1_9HEMI
MKQIETIAVLSVESDRVQLTVISNRDGSEVVTSAETFPLITAEPKSRRVGCNDDPSADQSHSAAVEADDRASSCSAAEKPPTGPGHVEQDPEVVWEAVLRVMADAVDKMSRVGAPVTYIKSVAVVNEMATLVAWNAVTGKAVHNMVHWSDVRMADGGTAAAVEWLLQRSTAVKCTADNCRFGTLDAWLTWKLTAGHTYQTDVTNASYTGLLDMATLCWDRDAVRSRGLTAAAWPAVRKPGKRSAAVIVVGRLYGLSVHATAARPSAVLYAQACYRRGQVAVTLTDRMAVAVGAHDRGPPCRQPAGGPMPVVGYCEPNMADRKRPRIVYGLMAVSRASVAVCWLRNMGLVKSWDDCVTAYAASGAPVDPGTYAVPAFGGLPSAPYVRPDARPVVCGFGDRTGRAHLIAAAVDSICHSTVDIVRCVVAGSTSKIAEPVHVDGPCVVFDGLMQRLSDVAGHRLAVTWPDMAVTGAARMAAAAINVEYGDRHSTVHYSPTTTGELRSAWDGQWAKAVRRSYGWAAVDGRELDDQYAVASARSDRFGVSRLADVFRRVGFWFSSGAHRLLYAAHHYFAPDGHPHRAGNADGSPPTVCESLREQF